ncbi:MAG: hypothetical protein GY871_04725 [Actinomycetales bacterium]|nr:hypothetical protein [Actinomycetales bacterium]
MNVIKLSAWGQLPQEEQDQALRKFVETPINGEVKALQEELAAYERQFGMSTKKMRTLIERGELQETAGICDWLIAAAAADCGDSPPS